MTERDTLTETPRQKRHTVAAKAEKARNRLEKLMVPLDTYDHVIESSTLKKPREQELLHQYRRPS